MTSLRFLSKKKSPGSLVLLVCLFSLTFSNNWKYLPSHLAYEDCGPTAVCPEEGKASNHQFLQNIEMRKMGNAENET